MTTKSRYQLTLGSILQSPWTLLTVAARAIGALSVMKFVAVFFGASGVALFSHFQNLVGLITQIPDQGSNLSIIRLYHDLSREKRSILLGRVILINLMVFLSVALILIVFNDFFARHFEGFEWSGNYFWLLLLAVFMMLLNSVVLAFVYAQQFFKLLFGLTIFNVLMIVGSVWIGSASGSVFVTMISYAMGWGLYSVVNYTYLSIRGTLPKITWKKDPELFRNISGFLLIAIIGVALGKWIDYFVRDFAIEWFGMEETGFWQAQVRISDSYKSVFMGTLGLLFYTQVSKSMDNPGILGRYVRQMVSLSLVVSGLGLLLVYLLRYELISLLFSVELLPAAPFIHFQLIADFFALPAYLLVFLLVAQKRVMRYFWVHLISAGVYLLIISVLSGWYEMSVEAIPAANMIRMFIFLIALLLSHRNFFKT